MPPVIITSKTVRHALPKAMRLLKKSGAVTVTQRGKPLFEMRPVADDTTWTLPDFQAIARKINGGRYRRRDLCAEIER